VYLPERRLVYRCPGAKILTTTGALVNDGATTLYGLICPTPECAARCCDPPAI